MIQLAATDANVLCAQALRSETSYWQMLSGQVLTGRLRVKCAPHCTVWWTYILLV